MYFPVQCYLWFDIMPCLQLSLFWLSCTIHVSTCTSQDLNIGVCSDVSNGDPLECCEGYRVVGDSCQECRFGTFGKDCKEMCPPDYYGRLCKEKCTCDPCDKVKGCINSSLLAQDLNIGVCSDASRGDPLECCEGYRVVGDSCQECWFGTFGKDCKQMCPPNFYGRLCKEKCTCDPCDKVKGCTNSSLLDFQYNGDSTLHQSAVLILSSGSYAVWLLLFLLF